MAWYHPSGASRSSTRRSGSPSRSTRPCACAVPPRIRPLGRARARARAFSLSLTHSLTHALSLRPPSLAFRRDGAISPAALLASDVRRRGRRSSPLASHPPREGERTDPLLPPPPPPRNETETCTLPPPSSHRIHAAPTNDNDGAPQVCPDRADAHAPLAHRAGRDVAPPAPHDPPTAVRRRRRRCRRHYRRRRGRDRPTDRSTGQSHGHVRA